MKCLSSSPPGIAIKWLSSFSSGAIGAAIFNPIDLVKVRFQTSLPGQPLPYNFSMLTAFRSIYLTEGGVRGLWAGVEATVVRAAFLTTAQLGTYDIVKNNLMVDYLKFDKERNSTHLLASLITSLAATTAANPADVIKTRVMNDSKNEIGGVKEHFLHVLRTEGPFSFLRGWTASYCRIGPHTIISFVMMEKIRQILGLATY